jgi:hypothetical protein
MREHCLLVTIIAALALAALAVPHGAAQQGAAELPRDSHQGLTITADPYDSEERSRARFGKKHPHGEGVLAVEVAFENEGDQGIRLGLEQVVRRPDGSRQRVRALDLESLLERMLTGRPPDARTRRTPLPLPSPRSRRSKDWERLEQVMRPEIFEMTFLPPRSTVRGFFFFDVGGRFEWLSGARLYVPELYRMPDHTPLLYFEIELRP